MKENRYSIIVVVLLTFISISNSFGQKEELVKFLDAVKTYEFDESKIIIRDYSFDFEPPFILFEYSSIDGILFDTDIPDVKGYKALINCKLENKLHGYIDKRMIAVMFFDKVRNHWAVFVIREMMDITNEYNKQKNRIDANQFFESNAKEFELARLANFCMMAGKLQDAGKYIEQGIKEAKANKNNNYRANVANVLNVIQ